MDQREITEQIQKSYDNWGKELIKLKQVSDIKTEVHLEDFEVGDDGVPSYTICVNHNLKPIAGLKYIEHNITITPTGVKFE
jgi:hypothetical protein